MVKKKELTENGNGPVDASEYKSVKVMAGTKQKLDLLAAVYQVSLIQIVEYMADEWWAWVSEQGDCALARPFPPPLE